jgi:methionyl-tRNA synthetase
MAYYVYYCPECGEYLCKRYGMDLREDKRYLMLCTVCQESTDPVSLHETPVIAIYSEDSVNHRLVPDIGLLAV